MQTNGIHTHETTEQILATIQLCEVPGHGPLSDDPTDPQGLYCVRCDEIVAGTTGRKTFAQEAHMVDVTEQTRQAATLEESVTYRKTYKTNEYEARVHADGTVFVRLPSGATAQYKSLSAAASAVTGSESINGRRFWGADDAPKGKPGRKPKAEEKPLHERLDAARTAFLASQQNYTALLTDGTLTNDLRKDLSDSLTMLAEAMDACTLHVKQEDAARVAEAAQKAEAQRKAREHVASLEAQLAEARAAAGL